ncbi:hypothetical protein IE81DRAFT_321409 [Ceraceosorus guamensis]|uniref:Uncharacterized protein n=1 Tax=Ceraceosorus guamensis TaxID=1522189 RepID=A0A316W3G1_9BASI|nr:hypothetical protein IE81DRAFT_321409 [Ceraceosorus guamensis]PWN44262.1 hypothetical protein IE81DRAFT_321409 [Ceraceosorus guamensis]
MKKFLRGGDSRPAGSNLPESPQNNAAGRNDDWQSADAAYSNLAPPQMPVAVAGNLTSSYDAASISGSIRSSTPSGPAYVPFSPQASAAAAAAAAAAYFDFNPHAALGVPGVGGTPTTPGVAALTPSISPSGSYNVSGRSTSPTPTTGTVSASPGGNGPQLERSDLHKSLKSLESLLVTFDEYRDLSARMAKCEKRLAKGAKELGQGKAYAEVPGQTLITSAALLESISEVSTKHSKLVQREYESLNDHCAKFFKRVAKEERAHDETLETLDSKVKKAHAGHEKNVKKSGGRAIESHDRYIAQVSALTADITRAKATHASSVGAKSQATSLVVAAALGGLADSEFRRTCEAVRRSGAHVGRVNSWLNLAVSEAMPAGGEPADLSEEEIGKATMLAIAELQAQANLAAREAALSSAREQAQAAWTAQQLGWVPPAAARASTPASNDPKPEGLEQSPQVMRSLPRLDSSGRVVDASATSPSFVEEKNGELDAQTARTSESANANAPPLYSHGGTGSAAAVAKPVGPRVLDRKPSGPSNQTGGALADENPVDAASEKAPAEKESIGKARGLLGFARRKHSMGLSTASNTATSSAVGPNATTPIASNPLERAATNAGMRSSSAAETVDAEQKLGGGHTQRDSSVAEGTIIDRGEPSSPASPPRIPTDVRGAALATSADRNVTRNTDASEANTAAASDSTGSGSRTTGNSSDSSAAAPATPRDLEPVRPLSSVKEAQSMRLSGPDRDGNSTGLTGGVGLGFPRKEGPEISARTEAPPPGQLHERRLSLWEREREREKLMEREADLARRLQDAETQLRDRNRAGGQGLGDARENVDSPDTSRSRPDRSFADSSAGTTPTKAAPSSSVNRAGVGSFSGRPTSSKPEPTLEDRERERERYVPSVGGSRLSGASVSRTLSTESERSFVARMKARYQVEKMEREEEQQNKGYRRVTSNPPADMPKNTRRVSDIASSYGQRAYDGGSALDRERDAYPAAPQGGYYGDRERARARSPVPPRAAFASPPPQLPSRTSADADDDPPHSEVCGCQRCSARHYGSGGGSANAPYRSTVTDPYATSSSRARAHGYGDALSGQAQAPRPPPRHPTALAAERAAASLHPPIAGGARDSATRRQSLPPPRSQDSGQARAYYDEEFGARQSPYRDNDWEREARQGRLGPYPDDRERDKAYPRRSYDDLPERRVAFAQQTQTIR